MFCSFYTISLTKGFFRYSEAFSYFPYDMKNDWEMYIIPLVIYLKKKRLEATYI